MEATMISRASGLLPPLLCVLKMFSQPPLSYLDHPKLPVAFVYFLVLQRVSRLPSVKCVDFLSYAHTFSAVCLMILFLY